MEPTDLSFWIIFNLIKPLDQPETLIKTLGEFGRGCEWQQRDSNPQPLSL